MSRTINPAVDVETPAGLSLPLTYPEVSNPPEGPICTRKLSVPLKDIPLKITVIFLAQDGIVVISDTEVPEVVATGSPCTGCKPSRSSTRLSSPSIPLDTSPCTRAPNAFKERTSLSLYCSSVSPCFRLKNRMKSVMGYCYKPLAQLVKSFVTLK